MTNHLVWNSLKKKKKKRNKQTNPQLPLFKNLRVLKLYPHRSSQGKQTKPACLHLASVTLESCKGSNYVGTEKG